MCKSKKVEAVLSQIPQYKKIGEEVYGKRKYGVNHEGEIGVWRDAVNRLHPGNMQMKLIAKKQVADHIYALDFARIGTELPPFQAGQYLQINLKINGKKQAQICHVTSSPTQRAFYEVIVNDEENEASKYLSKAKINDRFVISDTFGQLVYNPIIDGKNLVYLCDQMGIAPFMSMIREKAELGLDKRNVELNILAKDIPYLGDLQKLAKTVPNFAFKQISNISQVKVDPQATYYICAKAKNYQDYLDLLHYNKIAVTKIRPELLK